MRWSFFIRFQYRPSRLRSTTNFYRQRLLSPFPAGPKRIETNQNIYEQKFKKKNSNFSPLGVIQRTHKHNDFQTNDLILINPCIHAKTSFLLKNKQRTNFINQITIVKIRDGYNSTEEVKVIINYKCKIENEISTYIKQKNHT